MPAPKRDIYLLSARQLSPETIAVAFAKTSRLPDSFRAIAGELSDERSARFHEKWVVGYGHASVAEHAVLHLAIENVSRVAMEAIESNRLASYTEKSTRYQKWEPDCFHVPQELRGHALRKAYVATCRSLFAAYAEALAPVRAQVAAQVPRREGEADGAYDGRIRSRYVDACRFLLPAAALANVGMTANARALEHAIRKWRSAPLAEVRAIGEAVRRAALEEVPTLVKYAGPVEYLVRAGAELAAPGRAGGEGPARPGGEFPECCRLVEYDRQGEQKVLAAALYRFGDLSYAEALARASDPRERARLAETVLGRLGEHDVPLRELEHCAYTFELVMDQGAYAEFKRHRMMTQTPQLQTAALGYATPRLLAAAGLEARYRAAMEAAMRVWEGLYAWNPHVAGYVVPNGFNRRVLATFNLREAFAFCRLRAAPNAHFSIRRIAQRVHAEIARVHPLLAGYMRLPDETGAGIEAQHFAET